MADYVLVAVLLAVLTVGLTVLWRTLRGPARTRARLAARIAVAAVASAVAASGPLYAVMNSRTFQMAGGFVRRVETSEKVVALTFDDGPTPGYTREVLDALERGGAKATFFVTGGESSADMGDLRAIVEAGHEVGNHTRTHRRLVFLPVSEIADEFVSTDRIIRQAGYAGDILVRTPNGKRLLTAPLYFAANGRTNVFWDSEPDSVAEIADDPDAMADRVLADVRPGSIVLMHVMYDSRGASREALPRIIDGLRVRGYRFVTVSELMALGGR
jgi:peptidoglycan/xylan/chitin deacetylase (PgdA/CDA1 family)